jgi:hypothetical protein
VVVLRLLYLVAVFEDIIVKPQHACKELRSRVSHLNTVFSIVIIFMCVFECKHEIFPAQTRSDVSDKILELLSPSQSVSITSNELIHSRICGLENVAKLIGKRHRDILTEQVFSFGSEQLDTFSHCQEIF